MRSYRGPDEAERGAHVDNRQRGRLLLPRLAAAAAHPAEQDRVDGVGADGEDAHGKVARPDVEGRAREDEAEDGDRLGDGDVPRSLVKMTRGRGPEDGEAAGDEVGRAGEDECDSSLEAKRVDDGWELGAR